MTQEHRNKIGLANRKRKGMKMKRKVDLDASKVVSLWNSGYSVRQIANHFNLNFSTIKRRLNDVGVQNLKRSYKKENLIPQIKEKKGTRIDKFLPGTY